MRLFRIITALLSMVASASAAQFSSSSPMFAGAFGAVSSCIQGGNDEFTKVLLHFDGNLTDVNAAGTPRTWTSAGTGTGPTASPKFGTNSLTAPNPTHASQSTGARNYILTSDVSDINFGTQNFTIDFWMSVQICVKDAGGNPTTQGYVGQQRASSASIGWRIFSSPNGCASASKWTPVFLSYKSGFSVTVFGPQTSTSGFHHVAIVRNGNTFTMYVDGTGGTPVTYTQSVDHEDTQISIGKICNTTNCGFGSIAFFDEFRISVGVARWTSNFIPPSAPYCP